MKQRLGISEEETVLAFTDGDGGFDLRCFDIST